MNKLLINQKKQIAGFSLIELLTVIAVLGILAAILVPIFSNYPESSNRSKILTDLQILDQSTQLYMVQNSGQPGSFSDFVALGYIIAVPTNPGVPDVSYSAFKITDMVYKFTAIAHTYRVVLSGNVYPAADPGAGKTASIFTIEQLLSNGW